MSIEILKEKTENLSRFLFFEDKLYFWNDKGFHVNKFKKIVPNGLEIMKEAENEFMKKVKTGKGFDFEEYLFYMGYVKGYVEDNIIIILYDKESVDNEKKMLKIVYTFAKSKNCDYIEVYDIDNKLKKTLEVV
jgi:hypothetical protein